MRAKDFLVVESQNLFEVNMSPSNLKKLASAIDAKVGFEFEMIVPDVGNMDNDDYYDPEPDYDLDERTHDIEDVIRFFNDGEYNDRGTIRELRSELQEKYHEWVLREADRLWHEVKLERTYDYLKEYVDEDDIIDELEVDPDLFGNKHISDEVFKKFAQQQVDDEGEYYEAARDRFLEDVQDDPVSYDFEESTWLDQTYRHMSDIERAFQISWPHWTNPDREDQDPDVQGVANELEDVVGRPVNASTDYHGGWRNNDEYDLEPDSSLSGSGQNDYEVGLELISPPLSISEMLDDVKKIKKWADEKGVYTNRSTGLHMNISVPGFSEDKLDFVKLTLLLGDQYLLNQFGRSANTYCKSAMDIIKEAPSEKDKELLFKKLKDNIETIASKTIHSGRVGKFTSINPKNNRVEFRGPGGDWLGQNFSKVEDTLYRCVVALDAACDPKKYREDYLKKLTKMFAPTKGSIEDIFVQYAAGAITRSELKFKLKSAQVDRKQKKFTDQGIVEVPYFGHALRNDWIVEYETPDEFRVYRLILKRTAEVNDAQKAMEAAMKLEPSWFKPDEIENITVTEYNGAKDYVIKTRDGTVVSTQFAHTPLQALEMTFALKPELKSKRNDLIVTEESDDEVPAQQSDNAPRMAPGEQMFAVRNNDTGHLVRLAALNGAQAIQRAARNDPHNFQGGNSNPNITVMAMHSPEAQVSSPVSNSTGEVISYIVSHPDGTGQVATRASSPEQAIERVRSYYNISADRELIATPENG